jgi:hypothetical protein
MGTGAGAAEVLGSTGAGSEDSAGAPGRRLASLRGGGATKALIATVTPQYSRLLLFRLLRLWTSHRVR